MTRRELMAALLAAPLFGMRTATVAAQSGDLTSLTIVDALAQMAARKITPLQLTEAYLARITTMNRGLNAYVTVTAASARTQARRTSPNLSEPLRTFANLFGIPIAHKDLFETRGVRTTAGSQLFDEHVPGANAAIVEQLERAGAVLLGKTNTHELGGGVTTINPFYGTTRNPIDRSRIAGGSSGGSAAAVAAQLCAAATGSDTGGSVRIPAALCGCVGFKPTFGRISTAGLLGACPTFDHVGFLTRTVEDAEIVFRAAIPTSNTLPTRDALPTSVRVGLPRAFFFDGLEPAVAASVDAAIASLRARGHVVEDIGCPADSKTMSVVFDPIVAFEVWGRFGADWRATPSLFSKSFAEFFQNERPTIAEYESAQAALKVYQAEVDRLFDRVDVILTPTVPVTAPLIAGPIDGGRILRNTWPFNAAGTPAISIPCRGWSSTFEPGASADRSAPPGLPVGLQLVARRGDDDKLLRIARVVQTVLNGSEPV